MKRILAAIFLILVASGLIAVLTPRLPEAQTHTFPALDTNNTFTGTNNFSGYLGCKNLMNTRCVDSANSAGWAGSDAVAWMQAACTDLPSTGGVIRIDLPTPITTTNAFTCGSQTKQVSLDVYQAAVTFNGATGNGITLNCRGCGIWGAGALLTNFLAGAAFTGDLVHFEPAVGQTTVEGIFLRGVRLDGNGAGGYKLLNLLSVRNVSVIDNCRFGTFTGTAINVGISSNGGAGVSEGITFSNDFTQAAIPKTADTVIIQGNRVALDHFNVASTLPMEGTFRGIVFKSSANGDGRTNSISNSSSVSGFATGIAADSTNAGAQVLDLTIGPGVWMENFNRAIDLTGSNLAGGVSHAYIHGNNYLQGSGVGTPWVRFDFAQASTIDENMNGGTGTVGLTANSLNNTVRIFSNNAGGNDVSDAGVGNTVQISTNNGGIAQHILIGQVRIARDNTQAAQWDFLDGNSLTGSTTSGLKVGTGHITGVAAGTTNLGTNALPFGNSCFGTAATNNLCTSVSAMAAARTLTVPDPLGNVTQPYVIASGTSTLTVNAALAAVTSQAAITTAAANALTTDSIEWSYATAPTAGDSLCHVSPYVTAGNVNFVRTNPTAAAQSVSAIVINWRVIR